MNDREMYQKLTTDFLLFTLEPGNASRTKFAIEMAKYAERIDVELLEPEEGANVLAIKAEIKDFLL